MLEFVSLSPSKLGVLRDCERCFYDANVLKVPQPRGIFPSLPGGVDRVMKEHSDLYRGKWMPQLDGDRIDGVFWGSVGAITKMRNWKSGLKAELQIGKTRVGIIGALDDLIMHPNASYSPWDWKTKGDEPKDDGAQYYQTQVDVYALMLEQNGMRPSGKAFLCYWYPVQSDGVGIAFRHVLYELTASPERAKETITSAVSLLNGGQPKSNPACEYCKFAQARVEAALRVIQRPELPIGQEAGVPLQA